LGLSGGGCGCRHHKGWVGSAVYNAPVALEHTFEKLSVINSGLA